MRRLTVVLVAAVLMIVPWPKLAAQTASDRFPQTLREIQAEQNKALTAGLTFETPRGIAEVFFENNFMYRNLNTKLEFPLGLEWGRRPWSCIPAVEVGVVRTDPNHRFVYVVDPQGRAYEADTEYQLVTMFGCNGRFGDPGLMSWADFWGELQVGFGTLITDLVSDGEGPMDRSAERGTLSDGQIDNWRVTGYQKVTAPKSWFVSFWGRPRLEGDLFILIPNRDDDHDARYPGFDDEGMEEIRLGLTATKPFFVLPGTAVEFMVRAEIFHKDEGRKVRSIRVGAGVNFHEPKSGRFGLMARLTHTWRSTSVDMDGQVFRVPPATITQQVVDPENFAFELFATIRAPRRCGCR